MQRRRSAKDAGHRRYIDVRSQAVAEMGERLGDLAVCGLVHRLSLSPSSTRCSPSAAPPRWICAPRLCPSRRPPPWRCVAPTVSPCAAIPNCAAPSRAAAAARAARRDARDPSTPVRPRRAEGVQRDGGNTTTAAGSVAPSPSPALWIIEPAESAPPNPSSGHSALHGGRG